MGNASSKKRGISKRLLTLEAAGRTGSEPLEDEDEVEIEAGVKEPHSLDAQKDVGYLLDCSETEREWRDAHPEESEEEFKKEEPVDSAQPLRICKLCGEKKTLDDFYELETCGHAFCFLCLKDFLVDNLDVTVETMPTCPRGQCEAPISVGDLRKALETFRAEAEAEAPPFELMTSEQLRQSTIRQTVGTLSVGLSASLELFIDQMDHLVKCPSCKVIFEKVPVSADDPRLQVLTVMDERGHYVEGPELLHYLENRFRCQNCQSVFCCQCHLIPYHLNFTCRTYLESLCKTHCRYCGDPMPVGSDSFNAKKQEQGDTWVKAWKRRRAKIREDSSALLNLTDKASIDRFVADRQAIREAAGEFFVCSGAECMERANMACCEQATCDKKHLCGGIKGEVEHLPCLKEECRPAGHTTGEDYCNICWTEDLQSMPSISLGCGHIFHYQCIKQRVDGGFQTPYISFSHANCPLCDQRIGHPAIPLNGLAQMENAMRVQGGQRLAVEGMLEDADLQEGGEYHNRKEDYALLKLAFYQCARCKNPYYGGRKACDAGDANAAPREIDLAERVCTTCAGIQSSCHVHGEEYVSFKCRFCCSPSTFFCGGAAHFCTACHDVAGERVNFNDWSTKWEGVVPCPGPEACPFNAIHAPNGEEAYLGCIMCDAR